MLQLADRWIWDSWTVDDGPDHHLFFLQAPREGHPDGRHHRATVGHAVSRDYATWTVLPDALGPTAHPGWDDLAIWTGSVVRGEGGTWHLFYSAISQAENGKVQRIGRADSDDLIHFRRFGDTPIVQADSRWYETFDPGTWPEEAWRDPYVFPDPGGAGWHMLITGRVREGGRLDRGVIAHAVSPDLDEWEVRPPLTTRSGFGQLEVAHVAQVDGQWLLLFCCLPDELDDNRRGLTQRSGMWSAAAASPLGPFDLDRARPFEDPFLYAAHLVHTDDGQAGLLGFRTVDAGSGEFGGYIPPPIPGRLMPDGTFGLGPG